MIAYNIHHLANGLTLIHHPDFNTNLCVSNLLYNVGARDESADKTGFAHLFEHLMFGGSVNIPSFDTPLQKASGENNAFTSNDITNYYITLPSQNIETALWLESDRMLRLDFSEKSLAVQQGVVIEEFKQRYLNQPYGDAWLHLRPLAYQVHPYQWATIGKEISHVENANLTDVISFFETFYNPSNAVLCLAGNISFNSAKELTEKWFGKIPAGKKNTNHYPIEPIRYKRNEKTIDTNVPQKAIYLAFNMVERNHPLYYAFDLLSDILSRSESSYFINILIKEKLLFTQLEAYVSGDIDAGLFIIEGKLADDVSFETAENEIIKVIKELTITGLGEKDLIKVKNKSLTSNLFSKTSVLNKAMSLCYAFRLGDVELVNKETYYIKHISENDVITICKEYLLKGNHSVLKYNPTNE
ncbi:MAG: insulinase family protein [Bacteroidetes bacterium]|nr:insulinase family protein [Bacteroidota bacterium]